MNCSTMYYIIKWTGTESYSKHKVDEPHYSPIDGVESLHAIHRGGLGALDDFLCVVEQEHAEEHQSSVHSHSVQASSKRRGGGQEHGAWWTEEELQFVKIQACLTECITSYLQAVQSWPHNSILHVVRWLSNLMGTGWTKAPIIFLGSHWVLKIQTGIGATAVEHNINYRSFYRMTVFFIFIFLYARTL